MKRVLNLLLIFVSILNQAVSFQATAYTPAQTKAQVAPTATTQSHLNAAYPPPVTPTPQPTATPRLPTATKSPTSVPVTPTPVLTSTPTAIPTEANPSTDPQIRLEKNVLTYEPGKPIQFKWKIENSKSGVVSSKWQVRSTLPTKWTPADPSIGTFDAQKRQLKVVPSSLSNNLSISSALDSGDEDILVEMYDDQKYLSGTVLHLRAKTSTTIQKSGGEISGQAGRTKVKISFPSEVLPADSRISFQTPEEFPGTLPPKGKYVVQLDAQDLKGNAFHKFNGSAQLEISYDPEELSIHPSALALYSLDEETGAWRIVPGQADTTRNVFVAQTTHFSLYALGENSWESVKIPPLDSAQVASFTGAAAYSIPIEVPNGPGGIKPAISLDYNSMSAEGIYFEVPTSGHAAGTVVGAQAAWVGLGWNLSSGGFILRSMGKDISSDVDDTFSLVVGGTSLKLVPVASGSGYVDYRSSDDNFWKIRRIKQQGTQDYDRVTIVGGQRQLLPHTATSENDTWVAWDKTGTRFAFNQQAYYMEIGDASWRGGGNCPSCTDRPWGWFLTEIQYPSGQNLTFTYGGERDQKCYLDYNETTGECRVYSYAEQAMYPDEIQYPDGKTKIKFIRQSRPDYLWYWGDEVTMNRYERQRLSSIQIIVNSRITREYTLTYYSNAENLILPGSKWTPIDPVINNGTINYERISALKSVAQYGLDGMTGGAKLPDISFTYGNQMFLTDVDNGLGGKTTFVYEVIDPEAYNNAGAPFTASDGDPEQSKPLYHSSVDLFLHVGDNVYINPDPNAWNTFNGLPVRPGQGYRLKCNVNESGQTGEIKFGIYYDSSNSALKNYSKAVPVTNGDHEYTANVVIPANANRVTPMIKYFTGVSGSQISVGNCSGMPIMTHYRVTQRSVSDTTTSTAYTYSYTYEGAAVNDTTHSNYATLAANLRSGGSNPYSEFRGHSKVTVTAPDGLRTETYFYQNDVNKGRASEVRQYNGNYLLTRSITHWVDPSIEISNGQVAGICAKKTSSDPCYQNQKIVWSYTDWEESHQYGANVTDINSTLYTGVKKLYQYDTTTPYGYGNLKAVTEQSWSGSAWVSYRLTRTGYAANVSDGGVDPNATLYLVGLPGSTQVYQCVNGTCTENLANMVQYTCNLYDNPVTGGSGLCSLYQNGANKAETLDAPDSGLLTGTRTLLHFGDGVSADYTTPHYRDVQYRYDAKGNRIRTTQYPSEGTKTALDATGAQVSEACYGVADQPSGCVDDGYYAYPRWEKNALQQVTSWTINYPLGVPATETDPNGALTSADYDAFGRMITLARPGDSLDAPTVSAIYHDSTPAWVEVTPKIGAVSRKFYNGLGQLIQSQQVGATLNDPACSGTCTIVTDQKTEYVGGVKKSFQTMPHPMNTDPLGYVPQPALPWANATVTTYDVLDRPVTISAPDQTASSFSYSLDGNLQKTTATDPENHSTHSWKDAWGRTVKVQPATGPWLTYEYDGADRLTVVKQFQTDNVLFATTTITYDVAGRKTQMVDPDMGTWVYTYDAAGNMLTQRDAKLQTLWFGYDLLNRPLEKRASNASGTLLASYGYDEGENGIGRRSWMNAGDGSVQTVWSYDARGRVTQQTDVIAGVGAYTTAWSYDSADRMVSMVYPSGEMVNYTHLPQGGVSQVASSQAAYLTGAGYDASGRARERLLGNGVKNTWSYNAWTEINKGGRLNAAQAYKTGTSPITYLQNLSYSNYDKVGNLTTLSDYAASESLTFTYDALNRLDLVSGAYSDNPEYDARGNLIQKTGLNGTLSLIYPSGTTRPHAVQSTKIQNLENSSYEYDANGSMTRRVVGGVTYTLTYDIQNRLTGISGGGLSASYTYNADGARIKAVVTTGGVTRTTGYVGGYFEISLGQPKASTPGGTPPNCALPRRCAFLPLMSTGVTLYPGHAWHSYYFAGASRIALRIKSNQLNLDDGVFYFLSDHLGGTAITLDANGAKTAELRYTAWGETRINIGTTPTQRRYTGQLEAESGLYFYNARWYDPSLGRFAQADSMVPDPGSARAWDRYAYVNNNSVNYNDPTGHWPNWGDIVNWAQQAVSTMSDFTLGVVSESVLVNFGFLPKVQQTLRVNINESDAMLAGRMVADVASIVLGAVETVTGFTIGTGGVVLSCATTLCIGAVATTTTAVAVTAAGVVTVGNAAINLEKNRAQMARRDSEQTASRRGAGDGGRPGSNIAQNKQFRGAVQAIQSEIGRTLTKDEIRILHESLHGLENPGFSDIIDEGLRLFGK